ncbi:hypothetical protein SMICM17S_13218 [Streptomyces microflavus]
MPSSRRRFGFSSGSMTNTQTRVNRGMVEFHTPAVTESMYCSPQANRAKGKALSTVPTTRACPHTRRSRGIPSRRTSTRPHSTSAPKKHRQKATQPGSIPASTPILMSANPDPQIIEQMTN